MQADLPRLSSGRDSGTDLPAGERLGRDVVPIGAELLLQTSEVSKTSEVSAAQVAAWERELNALVYELYGLTEEEIAIVEGR